MNIFNTEISILGDLTLNPVNAIGNILTIDATGVVRFRTVSQVITEAGGFYTDKKAQDAVGNILSNTSEIKFTYDLLTPAISANLEVGSVDILKLDTGLQTTLGNADTAFSWGDHSLVGYLTTESDTLDSVTTRGNTTLNGITVNNVIGDYIDFNPITPLTWKEGRLFYDTDLKTLTLYNDESDTSLQIGEEQRVRVFNANGDAILNGQAVTVVGVTTDDVLKVERAIASDKVSALNTIGIATHDIEVGSYGYAATSGVIRGVDTSLYTEGSAIWLSSTTPGAYQTFRPPSPAYEVRMGGIIRQHASTGKIYAELRVIDNHVDDFKFFNGAILEDHKVTIVKTATTTTLNIVNSEGGNKLSVLINQDFVQLNSPSSILLTNGTDAVPVHNYIYISNTGVLTKNTSGFPSSIQHAPVAKILLQSAASVNLYGPYKVHAHTDHLAGAGGQGHLSHLNQWIRNRPALWKTGLTLTTTIGSDLPSIPISYSSGTVSQLHLHNFPAFVSTSNGMYGINNPTTPYVRRTSISPSINTDSLGGAIGNNKYYSIVIWGVVSEEDGDCKILFNLPSGSYTNITDALNDVNGYTSYRIPDEYVGTGFLLTKLTIKRSTSSVEILTGSVKDLRGMFPASGGGGGTIGGSGITRWTELIDTPLTIEPLKGVRGDAGGTSLEFYDTTFLFEQSTPSTFWTIAHPLKKYPSVTVIDSAGTQVIGTVNYIDINNLTITFNAGFSGTATLN